MRILFIYLFVLCSSAHANTERSEVISLLETEFGSSVRPYSTQDFGRKKYENAISVIIPEKDNKSALFKLRKKLPKGAIAFIGTTRNLSNEKVDGVELVVIFSEDKFDILRVSNSDGINYDITNERIIEKLKSWDVSYNIDIWHAETDTIQLTLQKLPEDLNNFAYKLYKFCPDIVDQGSGNISDISDYLKSEKAIYLWWD